ncbi:MAG: hypothetical protein M3Z09_12050 [Acidobacteriota bacterium]|nr:hypothetical protein [Acidobacteriota bacterium]
MTYFRDFYFSLLATLPWTYVVMYFQMPLAASHPFVHFLNGRIGGFLIFPGLCGGLNAAVIYSLLSILDRKKLSPT